MSRAWLFRRRRVDVNVDEVLRAIRTGGPEHDSPDMAPMVEFRKDGAQVPVLKGMLESLKGQNNHVSASACHLVEDVFSSPGLLVRCCSLESENADVTSDVYL